MMGGENSKLCSCKYCHKSLSERSKKHKVHQRRDNSALARLTQDLSQDRARGNISRCNSTATSNYITSVSPRLVTPNKRNNQRVDEIIESKHLKKGQSFEQDNQTECMKSGSPSTTVSVASVNWSKLRRGNPPPFPTEEVLALLPNKNVYEESGLNLQSSPQKTDHLVKSLSSIHSQSISSNLSSSNCCLSKLFGICYKSSRKQDNKAECKKSKNKERMTVNHESYLLSTNDHEDMEEWVQAIHRIILSPFGGGIFGQKLEETLRYDKRLEERSTNTPSSRQVPIIVDNCANFIRENNGLEEEGLFRLSGNVIEVEALQEAYDRGDRPTFANGTDVHTVASLFKKYLRELPEPVIPFSQYDALIDAAKFAVTGNETNNQNGNTEYNEKILLKIMNQLKLLPIAHYNLLKYLVRFLDEVQMSSKFNKMDTSNLSSVIGPNCIRTKENCGNQMIDDNSHVQFLMSQFVSNHKFFFPEEPLPDVAAGTNLHGSTVITQSPSVNTHDPGIGTLDSIISPQSTVSYPPLQRHPQAGEDSGTGSLGPTPDNTYRPHPTSHSITSGSTTSGKLRPVKPPRRKLAGDSESDGRRSTYDNIKQSGKTTEADNFSDTRSVSSYSTISRNAAATPIQSSVDFDDKVSMKANHGSSSEQESLTADYCDHVSSSSVRIGSITQEATDDESNTESIIERSSQSIGSISDLQRLGSLTSLKPVIKTVPLNLNQDDKIPAFTKQKEIEELISKSDSDAALTTVTSLNRFGSANPPSLTLSKLESSSVSTCHQPTYKELQQTVNFLKAELKRTNGQAKKRLQLIEDHVVGKMMGAGYRSAPYTSSNTAFNYPSVSETLSDPCSLTGYGNNASTENSDIDFSLSGVSVSRSKPQSNQNNINYKRKYLEEIERHEFTKIQLKNAKQGLKQERDRNITLQKDMKEFFSKLTNLTHDDIIPRTSTT